MLFQCEHSFCVYFLFNSGQKGLEVLTRCEKKRKRNCSILFAHAFFSFFFFFSKKTLVWCSSRGATSPEEINVFMGKVSFI